MDWQSYIYHRLIDLYESFRRHSDGSQGLMDLGSSIRMVGVILSLDP